MLSFIRSIQERDEAQPTTFEVILAYPGFHIMTLFHPVAHLLWRYHFKALARFWAYVGRFITGIEIHPGAQIGKNLFIDHGTGVVIGQTAIIGDDCRFYHNVTLGGKGETRDDRRHPHVGNHVTIGAGATVLGPVHLQDHAKVGANALVVIDVPAHMTAIGNPARLIGTPPNDHACYGLPDGDLPRRSPDRPL